MRSAVLLATAILGRTRPIWKPQLYELLPSSGQLTSGRVGACVIRSACHVKFGMWNVAMLAVLKYM